jgi:hypothetical protein
MPPSHFVIPAKAGIQPLPVNFARNCQLKPEAPGLDSRFRGNDEVLSDRRTGA